MATPYEAVLAEKKSIVNGRKCSIAAGKENDNRGPYTVGEATPGSTRTNWKSSKDARTCIRSEGGKGGGWGKSVMNFYKD